MNTTNRLWQVVAAAGLALLAVLLTTFYVTNYKHHVQHSEAQVSVVLAAKDIPADTPFAEVLRETVDAFGSAVADLKALDRPAGHDQELDAWFHGLDQEVAAFSRMQPAAEAGDQDALLRMFTSNEPLERKIQRAARRFGFHDCAR